MRERAFAILALLALVGCAPTVVTPSPSLDARPTATPTLEPTPEPSLPAQVDIEDAGALAIDATEDTDWVVVEKGFAWISGTGEGIGKFDAEGELVDSVALDGWCGAMGSGIEGVWSLTCDEPGAVRIDAEAVEVAARVPFQFEIADSETSIGVGEGFGWAVVGSGFRALLKLHPTTLEINGNWPLPEGAAAVRAGEGGVWITDPGLGVVYHFDTQFQRIVATIPVGRQPRFLAAGEGAVWVMNQADGTVSRISPLANEVRATIRVGAPIRGGDIAVGGGSVWVRGGPELLARIDPETNRVVERYGPNVGSGSVAADDDAVWVTAHDVQKIWRLPLR